MAVCLALSVSQCLLTVRASRLSPCIRVAPLAEESGLNIALTSRGEELDVSVCVCPDNVPEVDDIATGIVRSVDILLAAAQESPRGQGRSIVSEMSSHAANRSRGMTLPWVQRMSQALGDPGHAYYVG